MSRLSFGLDHVTIPARPEARSPRLAAAAPRRLGRARSGHPGFGGPHVPRQRRAPGLRLCRSHCPRADTQYRRLSRLRPRRRTRPDPRREWGRGYAGPSPGRRIRRPRALPADRRFSPGPNADHPDPEAGLGFWQPDRTTDGPPTSSTPRSSKSMCASSQAGCPAATSPVTCSTLRKRAR